MSAEWVQVLGTPTGRVNGEPVVAEFELRVLPISAQRLEGMVVARVAFHPTAGPDGRRIEARWGPSLIGPGRVWSQVLTGVTTWEPMAIYEVLDLVATALRCNVTHLPYVCAHAPHSWIGLRGHALPQRVEVVL